MLSAGSITRKIRKNTRIDFTDTDAPSFSRLWLTICDSWDKIVSRVYMRLSVSGVMYTAWTASRNMVYSRMPFEPAMRGKLRDRVRAGVSQIEYHV